MEVQIALMDKAETFEPAQHLATMKKNVDYHLFSMPVRGDTAGIEACTLAVDEFNLLMKRMNYDLQVYENWQKKCAGAMAARAYAQHEFRVERRKKTLNLATNFLDSCSKLSVWDTTKVEQNVADIMDFRREAVGKKMGVGSDKIPAVLLLNWTAPSTIDVKVQEAQIQMLGWALNDNMQSVALALNPVFTYSMGKLHKDLI